MDTKPLYTAELDVKLFKVIQQLQRLLHHHHRKLGGRGEIVSKVSVFCGIVYGNSSTVWKVSNERNVITTATESGQARSETSFLGRIKNFGAFFWQVSTRRPGQIPSTEGFACVEMWKGHGLCVPFIFFLISRITGGGHRHDVHPLFPAFVLFDVVLVLVSILVPALVLVLNW